MYSFWSNRNRNSNAIKYFVLQEFLNQGWRDKAASHVCIYVKMLILSELHRAYVGAHIDTGLGQCIDTAIQYVG